MATGSSRGDLGFIPSIRAMGAQRGFFGNTGHSSKKGVPTGMSRSMAEHDRVDTAVPEDTNMLGKRTEWLESQERKITATISKHTGDYKAIEEKVIETSSALNHIVSCELKKQHQQLQDVFNSMQTVYGKTSAPLFGINVTIEEYEKSRNSTTKTQIANADQTVVLCYPMHRIQRENGMECLMKCKSVNASTGQIHVNWVIVYAIANDREERTIREFSLLSN